MGYLYKIKCGCQLSSPIKPPHLFCGESDIESPSCKISKGCRFKEILGDSYVEHRVTAFWEHKWHWGEGGISEVFQWVECALWEDRERPVDQVKIHMCGTKEGGPSQVRIRKTPETR